MWHESQKKRINFLNDACIQSHYRKILILIIYHLINIKKKKDRAIKKSSANFQLQIKQKNNQSKWKIEKHDDDEQNFGGLIDKIMYK